LTIRQTLGSRALDGKVRTFPIVDAKSNPAVCIASNSFSTPEDERHCGSQRRRVIDDVTGRPTPKHFDVPVIADQADDPPPYSRHD
jgi:hypothetical protein